MSGYACNRYTYGEVWHGYESDMFYVRLPLLERCGMDMEVICSMSVYLF